MCPKGVGINRSEMQNGLMPWYVVQHDNTSRAIFETKIARILHLHNRELFCEQRQKNQERRIKNTIKNQQGQLSRTPFSFQMNDV